LNKADKHAELVMLDQPLRHF